MKLKLQTMAALAVAATAGVTLAAAQAVQINGAGATFPNPIYSKWFSEYNKLNPNVRINYQSLGSGAGIKQLTSQTVFFGASDQPMTPEQMQAAPGQILHFPTVLGAVVPIYNVPGVTQELKFSGPVLANIVLGKITKWNDPALVAINPGVSLPATDLTFVHRAEGSGTTYILVDFLAKVSPEFLKTVGVAANVKWPVGVAGKGSEGVTALVSQTPGSIGYVELVHALQNKVPFGSVQNSAGKFVRASIEATTAAAAAAAGKMPEDFRVSITNPPGDAVYPIASFTWLLLYENPKDKAQSKMMVDFLKWALTDGQKFASALGYAPVPKNVVDLELKALQKVKIQ
jgi:phosphate transport system substrate-binding protein